jgi:hypothetical protein
LQVLRKTEIKSGRYYVFVDFLFFPVVFFLLKLIRVLKKGLDAPRRHDIDG